MFHCALMIYYLSPFISPYFINWFIHLKDSRFLLSGEGFIILLVISETHDTEIRVLPVSRMEVMFDDIHLNCSWFYLAIRRLLGFLTYRHVFEYQSRFLMYRSIWLGVASYSVRIAGITINSEQLHSFTIWGFTQSVYSVHSRYVDWPNSMHYF